MMRMITRGFTTIALATALSLLAAPVFAQSTEGNGGGQGGGEAAALQQELRDLQRQLAEIRTAAMENNPELQERQTSLQNQVMTRMRDEGVNPEQDIRELQDLATRLRSGDLSQSEQQELAREYQQTRQELLEARRTALDDENIRQAQQDFREDLVTAMEAENPDVRALIEEFEATREALREQMQGGGPGAGGGASAQ